MTRRRAAATSDLAALIANLKVVVWIQENHTLGAYFGGLRPWGVNTSIVRPISANPMAADVNHTRQAWWKWVNDASTAYGPQFDTLNVIPFYAYLAITYRLWENHTAAFGTNSTANHLALICGQSPTLKNPSGNPVWNMQSIFGLAGLAGVTWKAYAASGDYPLAFIQQHVGSPNVVPSSQFVTDVQSGNLPTLSFVWHDSPLDEHPPVDVTLGMDQVWKEISALVQAGYWEHLAGFLTWDDWGGFQDSDATGEQVYPPAVEYTPGDNRQVAFGPRVPLLGFGGPVIPGIDPSWNPHWAIAKALIDLFGFGPMGVPRVDNDPGLGTFLDPARLNPAPPLFGQPVVLPAAPNPPLPVSPLPPPPVTTPIDMGPVFLLGGGQLPAPTDALLPRAPAPPS
jgi:hypothetical protein